MEIKKMGLEELSLPEQETINGGADVLYYAGNNPLCNVFCVCYNAGVYAYNWITGTPNTVRTVY